MSGVVSAYSRAAAADLRTAIYAVKRDGTGLRKIVQIPGYKEHSTPVCSHDGTRLAFDAIQAGTFVKKVFVVNADGTGLTGFDGTETPDWSPDDNRLAFRFDGTRDMKRAFTCRTWMAKDWCASPIARARGGRPMGASLPSPTEGI